METGSRGRYSWLTSADHDLAYLLMSRPRIVLGSPISAPNRTGVLLPDSADQALAGSGS
jgi:hypothetical protein